MSKKYQTLADLVANYSQIVIIQAENPDADSLGSALALEGFLTNLGKKVSLYCPVVIPKYIRYLAGWDRVEIDFDYKAQAAIIVDTASDVLLSKLLDDPIIKNWLLKNPSVTIDHHFDTTPSLTFKSDYIIEPAVATSEILYDIASELGWTIDPTTATNLMASIQSDTLGFTTPNVVSRTFTIAADLTNLGASPSQIEESRHELGKKSPEILDYKADLIKRIEYHLDGKLALVQIPFAEIKKYSDKYNPSVLVLDEMRSVEGVEVAIAIKTYPDGKLTGKVRTNKPVANMIAGYFGGGGHSYAAGFRTYETYDKIEPELLTITSQVLSDETL